jgi:hypothetical protein
MGSTFRTATSVAAVLAMSSSVSLAAAEDVGAGAPRNSGGSSVVEESSDANEPRMETAVSSYRFPNRALLSTGAVLLVGGYVPAVIGGALSSREEDEDLYIPVAGPWMTLKRGEEESGGEKTMLVLDGALQGVGALAVLTSFMIPERTTKNWYLIGSNEPVRLTTHGLGLGAVGRF